MFQPFPASPFPASTVLPPSPPQLPPGLVDRLRPPQVTLQALPGSGLSTLPPPSFGPLPSTDTEIARQQSLFREVLAVFLDLILRDNVPLEESDLDRFVETALRLRPALMGEIARQEPFFVLPAGMDNGRGGNLYLSPPPNGGKAWALVLGSILRLVRGERPAKEAQGEATALDPAKVLRLQQAIYQAGGPPPPSTPPSPPSPPSPPPSSGGDWGGILVLGGLLALAASSK